MCTFPGPHDLPAPKTAFTKDTATQEVSAVLVVAGCPGEVKKRKGLAA